MQIIFGKCRATGEIKRTGQHLLTSNCIKDATLIFREDRHAASKCERNFFLCGSISRESQCSRKSRSLIFPSRMPQLIACSRRHLAYATGSFSSSVVSTDQCFISSIVPHFRPHLNDSAS